jgi:8-oxo-dGTP pyrophosphatase MutT (NUDIX family)
MKRIIPAGQERRDRQGSSRGELMAGKRSIGSGQGLGAFAVILDGDGRVLLVHRRDLDLWNLPGGRVEPGETPWQAVVREVREETGLDVKVTRLAIVDFRPERDELVFTFCCEALGGAFVPNAEADASAYFPPAALPANMPPRHVERVQPALASDQETLLRVQPGPTTRQWLREMGKL